MHKNWLLAFSFLYTLTLFSGGNSSREKTPILPTPPHFSTFTDIAHYIAVPKNNDDEKPYTVFTHLLAMTASDTCKEDFKDIAVCFDFDDTLFEMVDREYKLRSPILPVVISQLNQCEVPLNICSRNPQIDEKNRDRFAIANGVFGPFFANYLAMDAERDISKTSIAVEAKGNRKAVLLVDDSERELNKINDESVFKLHFAKKEYHCSVDDDDAEETLRKAKEKYRNQEQRFVDEVSRELGCKESLH